MVSAQPTTAGMSTVAAAPAQPVVSGSFVVSSAEGVRIVGNLKLDAPAADGSAAVQASWTAVGGNGDIPCATGSNQSAVIVGTLAFTNETPNDTPDFYINFSDMKTGGTMSLGAGYSNGPQCITSGSDGWEGSAIQPTWTHAQWGPVPIAIVINNFYGPSNPNGDASLLGTTSMVINSQTAGSYGVVSTSGIVAQLNGPVMIVDLGQVASTPTADTGPTPPPASSPNPTTVGGYQTYRNAKFGFSVQIPRSFKSAGGSVDGDGASYTNADHSEHVTAYGQNNIAHKSATGLLNGLIATQKRAGSEVTYSAASGNIYSCSGYNAAGQIFYIHGVIGPRYQYELDWLYPKSDKRALDPAVQRSVDTFKPGPL